MGRVFIVVACSLSASACMLAIAGTFNIVTLPLAAICVGILMLHSEPMELV